ncbi:MAG TPA: CsgG/HfaB family protein [Bryobacteraceae bacterium]|nr:CsgG/HfaB family protein [Bryobacteraceae bacterium]
MLTFLTGASWSQVSPKKRVAVLDFENGAVQTVINSSYLGTHAPDVGKGVSELLISKLVQDGTVTVVERAAIDKILAEQNLTNSDRADPATAAKVGKVLGVEAIILGTITHYDYSEKIKKASSFWGYSSSPKAKYDISAKAQITTRLVSPDTAEVLAVSEGIGETERKGVQIDLRDTGARLLMASGVNSPVMNESIDKAVAQLAAQLKADLVRLPLRTPTINGLVADTSQAGQLVVNIGSRDGVKIGQRFQVLRPGKEVRDPVSGRVLMRNDTLLGEAVVTAVSDTSSLAQYQGTGQPEVRDIVVGIPREK